MKKKNILNLLKEQAQKTGQKVVKAAKECLILKKVDTVQKGRYSANGDKTGRKNRPGP